MNKLVGHGFVAPKEILPQEYVFGAGKLPTIAIQPNGQWLDFLPAGEWQARKSFETAACTVYSTLNPLEMLEKRLFGIEPNYAERPVYISMGITPPGSNPHLVSEWIRENGLNKESSLPFDDSITSLEEYRSPNPLPISLLIEIKEWHNRYDYMHEWVTLPSYDLKEKQERLMKNLTYSPLGVGVQAWQERNGLYYQDGEPNHWTCLVGFVKGEYWIVFDSYEPYIKKLEWDTDISFAKRYFIQKKVALIEPKLSLWERLFSQFRLPSCSSYA